MVSRPVQRCKKTHQRSRRRRYSGDQHFGKRTDDRFRRRNDALVERRHKARTDRGNSCRAFSFYPAHRSVSRALSRRMERFPVYLFRAGIPHPKTHRIEFDDFTGSALRERILDARTARSGIPARRKTPALRSDRKRCGCDT